MPSISELETDHKTQLANLVNAWLLWHKLWAENERDKPTDYAQKKKNLADYYSKIYVLTYRWLYTQWQYEQYGGVPVSHLTWVMPSNFVTTTEAGLHPFETQQRMRQAASDYIHSVLRAIHNPNTFKANFLPNAKSYINASDFQPVSGKETMGIIPLLVWAVIAIAAYFTVAKITENIDASRKDQTELINATSELCQQNHLTAEQCQTLVTQQTTAITEENKSNAGMGIFGYIALGFGALFLLNNPQILSPNKPKAA